MLAGAGLGDDARLAHALGEQGLADAVVHLVRAGVVQILALEVDLGAAADLGEALGVIDRRRTADEMLEFVVVLGAEGRVGLGSGVSGLQLIEGSEQRFGDEDTAVGTEMAAGVGKTVMRLGHGETPGKWVNGNRQTARFRDGSPDDAANSSG